MTSNLGSEYILENKNDAKELIDKELKMTFKPEFINRIDEIIIFKSLSKETVYEILDKIIRDIEKRLKDKNIKINLTDKAKKFIVDSSYNEQYGARPIKRFVTNNIENLLANAILNDEIKFGEEIIFDLKDNNLIIKGN